MTGAGAMVESVAFDARRTESDGMGGTNTGWAPEQDAYTCTAHFRYLRGGERVMAARLDGRQPVVVTVHATTGALAVTTDHRMRDTRRGTVYNIRAIVPTDNRQYLEITAESGVAP